ncbi:MAG: hypothetical protein H0V66_05335 [Bdellovibrionales bacterium]|nr:hypothetical protein [Bdellovibrionales bacterium]
MKVRMIVSQIILTAFLSFILVSANAATPEENFAADLNISIEAQQEVVKTLDEANKTQKKRIMFCSEIGAAAFFEIMAMSCTNFKGQKLELSFVGFGASLSLHTGVAILYPKKGSRLIKEGTYRHSVLTGLHLGLGIMGINIHNDNESIRYRVKGVTVGAGFDVAEGLILVNDPATPD